MLQKIKKFCFSTRSKVFSTFTTIGTTFLMKHPSITYASDFSWLTDPNKGNDTFNELTTTVQQTGNSFYQLVMAGSIVGLLVSVILVGVAFSVNKNAAKKEENKSHMLWIVIGGAIVFGAPSLLGLLYSIGQGF